MDNTSTEYKRGYADGYDGEQPESQSQDYVAGYQDGESAWREACEAEEHQAQMDRDQAEYEAGAYWSEVESGMYDDDPNPYHGDYSEM